MTSQDQIEQSLGRVVIDLAVRVLCDSPAEDSAQRAIELPGGNAIELIVRRVRKGVKLQ